MTRADVRHLTLAVMWWTTTLLFLLFAWWLPEGAPLHQRIFYSVAVPLLAFTALQHAHKIGKDT